MSVNYKVLVVGLGLVGGAMWVLAQGFGRDPRALPDVMTGKAAPAFERSTLDGAPTRSADLAGRPYLLNFWSTWCLPCKQEEPDLQALAKAFGAKVTFLGVLYEDDEAKARRYLQNRPSVFPTLADPSGSLAVDYGVGGVPETFVVDAQGRVVHKVVGPVDPMALAAVLERL